MVTAHASRLATLRHASSTRVDATLAALFDARPAVDERLEAAMRHGLLVGGKRLRPLLVYLAGQALGQLDSSTVCHPGSSSLVASYKIN